MRMITQKETVVSPEPVLIRDDQTGDTNLDNSRVERESETTGKIWAQCGIRTKTHSRLISRKCYLSKSC